MENMKVRRASIAVACLLLTGCGAAATTYVRADDPVLTACQSPAVGNIASLQNAVDYANNTGGINGPGDGQQMLPDQVASLKQAAVAYRIQAARVGAHPAFAAALRNEAQEFTIAAFSPTGLTTNTVAVAADRFSSQIQADCASFQVGTAPKPGKPAAPADWGLVWAIIGGYLIMALAAGYLIAVGQRSRPRGKRLQPGEIFWLSLVWWVTIFTAIARAWGHMISSATLTQDEKKDDRIAAQQKAISKLEDQLKKPGKK